MLSLLQCSLPREGSHGRHRAALMRGSLCSTAHSSHAESSLICQSSQCLNLSHHFHDLQSSPQGHRTRLAQSCVMPVVMETLEFCTRTFHSASVSHPPDTPLICVLGVFRLQLQGPSLVGVFRSQQGADALDSCCPRGMGEPPAHQGITALLG